MVPSSAFRNTSRFRVFAVPPAASRRARATRSCVSGWLRAQLGTPFSASRPASCASSALLRPRKVEHDLPAASPNGVDADLAVDAFDLASGDVARAADGLRGLSSDGLAHDRESVGEGT